jgi:predicted naringenin-chalcone synthase/acyl carrier protein
MADKNFTLKQIKDKIKKSVAELLNVRDIATDVALMDSGLSSVATTELSMRLSKDFGVKIRPTIVFTSPTIDDISERVFELLEVKREEAGLPSNRSDEVDTTSQSSSYEAAAAAASDNINERPEAFIAGWGIATPFPLSAETYLEIDKRERKKLGQSQEIIDQMAQLVKASRIYNRHTCHPYFLPKGKKPSDYPDAVGTMKEDIYSKYDANPPLRVREACYNDTAVKMCIAAAEKAVKCWGKDKSTITHIISTCTSGWTEPGIGCSVIKALGLTQDIQKQELNFNGCFCGATCLRMARDFIRSGAAEAVLIVACEVATTHYDFNRTETERMIAQSLFADGAASLVVAKEGVWRYSKTGSAIVPESGHLLGLRPPQHDDETQYIMTLSKMVAPSLYAYFSKGHGVDIIKKLYNPREPKPALAIHPGGPRILEAVGDVFFELGWQENALQASFDTFGNFGNLGSAAMLFVLANRLGKNDIREDKLLTMAFGPGVTVEYALLEHSSVPQKKRGARKAAPAVQNGSQLEEPEERAQSSDSSNMMLILGINTIAMLIFGAYFIWSTSQGGAGRAEL